MDQRVGSQNKLTNTLVKVFIFSQQRNAKTQMTVRLFLKWLSARRQQMPRELGEGYLNESSNDGNPCEEN